MNTIATATNASAHQALLERTSSETATGKAATATATATTKNDAARVNDRAPATTVELSDRAKALLERSKIDQAVADWLAATVKGDGKLPKYTMLFLDEVLTVFDTPNQSQVADRAAVKPTETIRGSGGPAPYGDPAMTKEKFIESSKERLLDVADFLDRKGYPPESGQGWRDAVKNGTVKILKPSDIPELNFLSTQTFTPSAVGGGYDSFGSTTWNPTGIAKELSDQGRLIAGWSADIGEYVLTW